MDNPRYVVTGGPGGGKTTLLAALAEHGFQNISESARCIIQRRLALGLPPRPEPVAFAWEVLNADTHKYQHTTCHEQAVFFDRSVLDALYMLNAEQALPNDDIAQYVQQYPYHRTVFLLPPWEDIYQQDSERDQGFEQAIEVYQGMKRWYSQWGYDTLDVPCVSLEERVTFLLKSTASL